MSREMEGALAAKAAEHEAARQKQEYLRSTERETIAAPGTGRRTTTPSLSNKRKMIGL